MMQTDVSAIKMPENTTLEQVVQYCDTHTKRCKIEKTSDSLYWDAHKLRKLTLLHPNFSFIVPI